MTRIRLPYIHEFRDRHGKVRRYVRLPGCKRIALHGQPGTDEFMSAYRMALEGQGPKAAIGASRTMPGTVAALVVGYFNSAAFQSLADSTKATYRGIIERFREDNGDKRVAMLERRHVENMISKKASTPAAANNLLRMIRTLMQFGVANGMVRNDPAANVKGVKSRSEGFYSWSDEDIAAFEAKHPVGSRARLAMALLLFTAQRRSDVVRLGRQHVRAGVLSIRQQKTGALVEIPVHSELQEIIDATPNNHLTFLVTEHGKPFTAAGFGNLFRDWCNEAKLPKACAAHGLRKAASRRLAEAGCSAHEIMAVTGHKTLKEVTRYTAAVDRKRLGKSAMEKINTGTSVGKPR